VLIPFINGATFTENEEYADTIIESTESFEKMWYNEVDYLLEYKFLNWLFSKRLFKPLFDHIAGKQLKHYYKGKETVIIYNSTVHERCMSVAKKALPLYTTYGSQ
jgi:hypothetical protein